jgi:uncharacterized protein YifE (UPF0438 family)
VGVKMEASHADQIEALDKLNENELHLLGVDEKPVYISSLLRKLEKLADEKRRPQTRAQQHFIDACNNRCSADTPHELSFIKYRLALLDILSKKENKLKHMDTQASGQLRYIEQERREWQKRDRLNSSHYDP